MNKILHSIILALLASNAATGGIIAPLGEPRSKFFKHPCSPEGKYTVCDTNYQDRGPNDFTIVKTSFGTMRCAPFMVNRFIFLDDRLITVGCTMKARDYIPFLQGITRRYGAPEERLMHSGNEVRRTYVWHIGDADVTASDIIEGPDLFGVGAIGIDDMRVPR